MSETSGMLSLMKRMRYKRLNWGLAFVGILALFYIRLLPSKAPLQRDGRVRSRVSLELPCSRLPGANETLVVMRTGATEFQDKLPAHLSTTLRCYPNYIIFADFEEEYRGERIVDVLESVDPVIKDTHKDFELYRRLRTGGRAVLSAAELSGPGSRSTGNTGKAENPGWKLDKWKFLPMMNRTLSEYPDMKWYVFVETDTYIFWATLLEYLAALDYTKPYYIGGQIWIGDIVFAHGGTSFAVSNEALRRVTDHYKTHQKEWEDFTDGHWAGDCVLGKAFKDAGAPLTYAWPIFQADNPGIVPYGRTDNGHRLWCHPTVSYHHLTRDTVKDMWDFEQQWLAKHDDRAPKTLRHKDVFEQYIIPRMRAPKADWDNECDEDQGRMELFQACEAKCESMENCLQYSLSDDGVCRTSTSPKLGEFKLGVRSGWILKRIQRFPESLPPCEGEKWII